MRIANFFLTPLLLAALLLTACATSPAPAPAAMKQYPLKGEIMGLDASQHVATIRHEAIPNFMKAMTMGYPVKDPAEFRKLAVGDRITATVYASDDDMYLGNIQKLPQPPETK